MRGRALGSGESSRGNAGEQRRPNGTLVAALDREIERAGCGRCRGSEGVRCGGTWRGGRRARRGSKPQHSAAQRPRWRLRCGWLVEVWKRGPTRAVLSSRHAPLEHAQNLPPDPAQSTSQAPSLAPSHPRSSPQVLKQDRQCELCAAALPPSSLAWCMWGARGEALP